MSDARLVAPAALTLLALSACQATDVTLTCVNGEPLCDILEVVGDPRPLATGVDVIAVDANQGARVPLMADGELVESEVGLTLIGDRGALFRATVSTHDGFVPRDLTARLYLYDGEELLAAYQADDKVLGETTFELLVDGGVLDAGAALGWRVELVEASAESGGGEDEGEASWPAKGELPAALPIQDTLGPLKIVLLPIAYGADGSGRLPDTSDEQIAALRERLYAIHPVSELEITVVEPYETDTRITDESDWAWMLSEVGDQRHLLGIPPDTYFYGIVEPAATFADFCGSGCITGISNQPESPLDSFGRASVGVWYGAERAFDTMAHELGHAQGRDHADCGNAGSPDDEFPYEGGSIGSWGYDLVTGEHYDPDVYADMMGYCSPAWVSDYHFELLFERLQDVNDLYGVGTGAARAEQARSWRTLWRLGDGTVRWGFIEQRTLEPVGDPIRVELLDASGAVIAQADAWFSPFDHAEGGLYRLLEPAPEVVDVRPVGGEPWGVAGRARP